MAEWDEDGPSWQERAQAEQEAMTMGNELRCPLCGSHDVECLGRPRGHICHTCGYDGRSKLSTAQVIASAEASRDTDREADA